MTLIKYPRTYHWPFSPEIHSDDKTLRQEHLANFINQEVVITEKLDGGNCCLTSDNVFARSHSGQASHPSFAPIKALHATIKHQIPNGTFIFGENIYGVHTIKYEQFDAYLYVFAVSRHGMWLSYDAIVEETNRLGLKTVPLLHRGVFQATRVIQTWHDREINQASTFGGVREGFVTRVAHSFKVPTFSQHVVKYVRQGHVQDDQRWEVNWQPANVQIQS